MMNKRKKISGGFIQGIEQEEIEEQISDEKKLNFNAVYVSLFISIVSLPINLTVCSIILPDPTLI